MFDAPKLPTTPGQDPKFNQSDKKVVTPKERVENIEKHEDSDTRDMGDVVARDSAAKDGVKQSP